MRWLWCLLFLPSLCACAASHGDRPSDSDIAVQFVDAETMKPMEGVYLTAAWQTITPPGKVGSELVAIGTFRSGADGWIRQRQPGLSPLHLSMYQEAFAPGYEYFHFEKYFASSTAKVGQIYHIIWADDRDLDLYPAWADSLRALGYEFSPRFRGWRKEFPNRQFLQDGQHRYLIKNRAAPGSGRYADGSTQIETINGVAIIGISETEREFAWRLNLVEQVKVLCDPRWDTARSESFPYLIRQILELTPGETHEARMSAFKKIIPDYLDGYDNSPRFTKEQRLRFCAWIRPFAEKVK